MKRSHFLATPRARARSGLYSRAQHLAYRLVSSPREEARGPQVLAPPTSACRLLKEESDFRNERDVVPAAIRAGPNRRFIFFCFYGRCFPVKRDAEDESFLIFLVFSCVFHGSWFRAGECSFKIAYTTTVEPFARALADWLKIGALWRGRADETASNAGRHVG
jgi:hypothetical protein